MTDDARDLANTLNGELQGLWSRHGLNAASSAGLAGFKADMIDTLVRAARDPDGFLAQHHPQHRARAQAAVQPHAQAGQPSRPSSEGSVDSWADAYARASSMPKT
jgi:hypothetical protein